MVAAGLTMAVALLSPAGETPGIEIRHTPLACVPSGAFSRVSAETLPAAPLARVEAQFRVDASGGWYSLRLVHDGGGWSGRLPRPVPPLARFEYRIVATGSDLAEVATQTFGVRVSSPGSPCESGSDASTADETPIAVRVPPGAPVAPPVPAGFSPAGVVAVVDPVEEGGKPPKLAMVGAIAGAVAAGIAVATSASGSSAPPIDLRPPDALPLVFSLSALQPAQNSVLSLSAGGLAYTYRVTGAVGVPLSFAWRVELWSNVNLCVTMVGEAGVGPLRPESAVLTGPLVSTGTCGSRFDVELAHLTISIDGQPVHAQYVTRRFHIEP